ncbi:MAG: hypothetical protein NTU53_23415 [Planctomycetota bacterium]|nr:hypothetical protein [Planctomycetota bacterium]
MNDKRDIVPAQPASVPAIPAPPPRPAPAPNPLLILHALLRGKYKWAVPLALVGAILGSSIAYLVSGPKYRSAGLIQIKPTLPRILYNSEQNNVMPMFDAFVESQVMLIRSQRVLTMAMQNPDWKSFGRGLKLDAQADFIEGLEVAHPKNSEMILVAFLDRDPDAAVTAVAAVIAAYQKIFAEYDVESVTNRAKVLEERQTMLNGQLKSLNERIFAIGSEFGSDKLDPIYAFKLQELNNLESGLKAIQLALALKEGEPAANGQASTQPAASASQPSDLPDEILAASDADARDMLGQERRLKLEVERLAARFGESHPQMRDARSALKATQESLRARLEGLRKANKAGFADVVSTKAIGLHAESPTELRARQQRVKPLYDQAKQEVVEIGRKNLQIAALHADADAVRSKLEETKVRMEQLSVESPAGGRMVVVSTGDRPVAPHNSKRGAITAAGGCAGGGGVIAVFVLIALLDRRLRTAEDTRRKLSESIRILGILPDLEHDLSDPTKSAVAAHCIHQIRASLQIDSHRPGPLSIAITSPSPGDGKSSLTLALGLSFAASRSPTLLIDCDFAGGGLTRQLGATPEHRVEQDLTQSGRISQSQLDQALEHGRKSGVSLVESLVRLGYVEAAEMESRLQARRAEAKGLLDVLEGRPLGDCVVNGAAQNLFLLPLGRVEAHHAAQLSPASFRKLIGEACRDFETVLVDTGPALGSLETAIVAAETDKTLLVVSRGEHRPLARQAINHLLSNGARIAGIVFNRARMADIAESSVSSLSRRSAAIRASRSPRQSAPGPAQMGPIPGSLTAARPDATD